MRESRFASVSTAAVTAAVISTTQRVLQVCRFLLCFLTFVLCSVLSCALEKRELLRGSGVFRTRARTAHLAVPSPRGSDANSKRWS